MPVDFNRHGIDGPIFEAIPGPYLNCWFAPGWNIVEVDGHNVLEMRERFDATGLCEKILRGLK